MSDAGDNVEVEAAEAPEVSEAPKGKLSVEDALEVHVSRTQFGIYF
jgi:small subunit ribosomal protein S12e